MHIFGNFAFLRIVRHVYAIPVHNRDGVSGLKLSVHTSLDVSVFLFDALFRTDLVLIYHAYICVHISTNPLMYVGIRLKSPEHGLGINMGKNLNYPQKSK